MRAYPHKPDAENVAFNLESSLAEIEKLIRGRKTGELKATPRYFQYLGQEQTAVATESYATEKPMAEVKSFFERAKVNLSEALTQGAEFDPSDYIDMLAIAVITGDMDFASRLAAQPRERYTTDGVEASEIHYLVPEILGDLVLGKNKEFNAHVSAAQKELAGKKVAREIRQWAEALVAIAAAIGEANQAALDAALAAREKDFVKTYRSPDDREDSNSLLDTTAVAFLHFAVSKGLKYSKPSVYIPHDLIGA